MGVAWNLGGRIGAATKTFGAHVLISTATLDELGGAAAAWTVHRVALPGKSGEFVLHQMPDAF